MADVDKRRTTVELARDTLLERYGTLDPQRLEERGADSVEIGAARNVPQLLAEIDRADDVAKRIDTTAAALAAMDSATTCPDATDAEVQALSEVIADAYLRGIRAGSATLARVIIDAGWRRRTPKRWCCNPDRGEQCGAHIAEAAEHAGREGDRG